jgi:nitrogen-specific signal transduction histidine kinase
VLENAVAALEHAKEEGGIRLALIIAIDVGVGRQFTLDVRNTYAGEILKNGQGELLSTKHEGTGVGTASVTAVAERMGGFARFGNEGGMFRAYVLMPLG